MIEKKTMKLPLDQTGNGRAKILVSSNFFSLASGVDVIFSPASDGDIVWVKLCRWQSFQVTGQRPTEAGLSPSPSKDTTTTTQCDRTQPDKPRKTDTDT